MKTLAFINLKGGVGKTVSAANVAHILAMVHHKKVLLMEKILEWSKDDPDSSAAVLPEKLEDEADAPKVAWTPAKESLSKRKAAMFLEDLRTYCEEMVGRYDERERWKMWENYSDALDVAIADLRK